MLTTCLLFVPRPEKTLEYDIPCQVLSADLHPDGSVFVCGGEDFKMYKFDYTTGLEIGELIIPSLLPTRCKPKLCQVSCLHIWQHLAACPRVQQMKRQEDLVQNT